MLKRHKGNLMIECLVGIFIVLITSMIIFTTILDGMKSMERRKELKMFNENIMILINEIKYNEKYCDMAIMFNSNEKVLLDFKGEHLNFNEGSNIKVLSRGETLNSKGWYEVTILSFNKGYAEMKIKYKLNGVSKCEGEKYFKKYRYMESQENWLYSS